MSLRPVSLRPPTLRPLNLLDANDRPGVYPPSLYAAELDLPAPRPPLRGALRVDVAVVGGGFLGLSAARALAGRGYRVAVLESSRAGFGASGRNGGQVGMGQRQDQDVLERLVGQADARALWQIGAEAVAEVRSLARDLGLRFDDGIITACHRARDVAETHAYAARLNRDYDYPLIRALGREEMRHLVGSPGYHGGTLDMGGGHVQPLALALGLARLAEEAGAQIHEGSRVLALHPGPRVRLVTDGGEVTADHVILGCNGYLGRLVPKVAARVMPINNFIIATAPLPPERQADLLRGGHAVADTRHVVNYFRLSPDGRLLFGGGESYGYRFPRDIAALVRRKMEMVFPQTRDLPITHAWGGTLAITLPRLPHVARTAPNVLSLSGWSGHGVALACLGGRIAAETVAGQAERFDLLARLPVPPFPGGTLLRQPLLVAAMLWFSLRDRL